MNLPHKLKLGDKVGLIALSSPVSEDEAIKSVKELEKLGFIVDQSSTIYKRLGYMAGSKIERASELNRMFKDKSINAIFCIRGGYSSIQILDLLDYEIIKYNPKIFVGFSDVTCVHFALNKNANLITYHGPMVKGDLSHKQEDLSFNNLLDFVMDDISCKEIKNLSQRKMACYKKGDACGKIIGGNLSLICSLIGTEFEPDFKNKILFIEDVNEEPYKINGKMWQLKLCGKLDDIKGLIIGDFSNCIDSEEYSNAQNWFDAIEDVIKDLEIPILYNVEIGHCYPKITVPIGMKVNLHFDYNNSSITLM